MRRAVIVACVAALAVVQSASAVVLKTNWVETTQLSSGGSYTVYVRKIEITRSRWRAWVGLVNKSRTPLLIQYGVRKVGATTSFLAGPGLWYQGSLGDEVQARHANAKSVRPALPHRLGAGKAWFATMEGPTARLPKDRLLRIGFGWIGHDYAYPTEISTTHEFKLPRRL